MIQGVGNIELCELLEMEPKTQCTVCLSCWNTGIFYCTCVHFLHKEIGANLKFIKFSMDLLSVPEYVIDLMDIDMVKSQETKEYRVFRWLGPFPTHD